MSHGGITVTSVMEEMPPPNLRRLNHSGITITSGVREYHYHVMLCYVMLCYVKFNSV